MRQGTDVHFQLRLDVKQQKGDPRIQKLFIVSDRSQLLWAQGWQGAALGGGLGATEALTVLQFGQVPSWPSGWQKCGNTSEGIQQAATVREVTEQCFLALPETAGSPAPKF